MKFWKWTSCILAASSVTFAMPVQAAYLIDTGPGNPAPQGWSLNAWQSLAASFVLDNNSKITSIEAFMGGTRSNVIVSIYRNIFDDSTIISSFNFETLPEDPIQPAGFWQGVDGINLNLSAGTYWIAFSSDGMNYLNDVVPAPLEAYAVKSIYSGWAWTPSSLIQFGARISGVEMPSVGSPVPEPESWLTMVMGLFAAGSVMRRRSHRVNLVPN
jgi:hypothetical protein